MSLFSIIISEYTSIRVGKFILFHLPTLGIYSIYYWHVTELAGTGDLGAYAIVQFFPMLAMHIILITYKADHNGTAAHWCMLASYIIAKVLEYLDEEIHHLLTIISGHSLKHVAACHWRLFHNKILSEQITQ